MGKSGRDYTREDDWKKRMRETVAAYKLTAIMASESKDMGSDFMCFERGFQVFSYCLATCPLVYSSTFAAIALCTNPSTDEHPDDVVFSSPFSNPSTLRRKSSRANLDYTKFAAEVLRFSFAKSSQPPLKM